MENTELEKAYLAQIENQAATIDEQRTRISALMDEVEKYERLKDRLYVEADDREWCEEFDDVMEELGFPRRERQYDINVFATVRVRIERTITATSLQDALDSAHEALPVKQCIEDGDGARVFSVEIESASES